MLRNCFLLLIVPLVLATGCQEKEPPPPQTTVPTAGRGAAKLTVLVVDDPALAAGIKLLRGEWAERSGGQINVEQWSVAQLLSVTEFSADLVIYPSRYVGTLVAGDWLRPLRSKVLQNSDLSLEEIFPLLRNFSLRYGGQIYGLSLGEPPLLLASPNAASLKEAPASWDQVRLQGEGGQLDYPLASELLARALAAMLPSRQAAGCFDAENMQPRITEPPYVRALQQMLVAGPRTSEVLLGWPTSGASELLAFAALPRAASVYNPTRELWEKNTSVRYQTLLGWGGRTASVTRATRNSASAFKLLTWLASERTSTQLSPRSRATAWMRKSQLGEAAKWLPQDGAGGEETIAVVNALLSSQHCFVLPRIPGIDKYLEVIEEEIAASMTSARSAEAVLEQAARRWEELTDRYGRDRQRVAYRKHLGWDDFNE